MNIIEYNKVKDFSYEEYCDYLKNKYGPVLIRYNQVNKVFCYLKDAT